MKPIAFVIIPLLLTISLPVTSNAAALDVEMVYVKGNCFQMGDSSGDIGNEKKPTQEVCVSDYYIGKHEVSQALWHAVMGNNPSRFSGDKRPIENVSWNDAQQFIAKLNKMTGKHYRLPTEAEWEYAARSGGKRERWAGTSDLKQLGEFAWFRDNSSEMSHDIGTKKPNALGIYDMSGNVWEWAQDKYGEQLYEDSDIDNPQGPTTGTYRVIRGGSWISSDKGVLTSYRRKLLPDRRLNNCGIRLVLPASK